MNDVVALLVERGMLLESARGPIPNVAQLVAAEPIKGSWWGHEKSHAILAVMNDLADSPDVVRLRLVNGKITLSGPGQLRALNGDLVPGIGTTILPYTVAIQTFGGKGIGHWTLDVPFFAPVAICSELLTSGNLVMALTGRREELSSR